MEKPFDFLAGRAVEFFDEGSWRTTDLLTREVDADLAYGSVSEMVVSARQCLEGIPEVAVRPILWVGDLLVGELVSAGRITLGTIDGRPAEWSKDAARRVGRLQMLPVVLGILSDEGIWLGDDEQGIEVFEVLPERFCAAFVLRAIFSSVDFGFTNGLDDLPVLYLIEAATVAGYMASLRRDDPSSIGSVVRKRARAISLKQLQDARHAENRQMADEVLAWWEEHKNDPGMTKDKAADLLAGKVVPLKWRTVRDRLKGV